MYIKNSDIIWPAYFVVFDLSDVKNLNNIISYIIPTYIIYIKYSIENSLADKSDIFHLSI